MKKSAWVTILFVLAVAFPATAAAAVDISIGISLPPLIAFPGPPNVVVLPDTDDVYVVPDIDVDVFFWGGWWWRPWEGRWYRSRYYDRGWAYYRNVPSFYFDVDPGWRGHYRDHDWYGHPWQYERIPNRRLQQNWKSWHDNRHWEGKRAWGVQDYRPRPKQERQELRHQRQEQYQQRPEVQRHQQQMQERRPQAPQRRPEPRERSQQMQRQEQRPPAVQHQMQPQNPEHPQPPREQHQRGPEEKPEHRR